MSNLKSGLHSLLAYARRAEEDFVDALGGARLEARGSYARWSVKDVLGHIAA
jgi:hypothetical protein